MVLLDDPECACQRRRHRGQMVCHSEAVRGVLGSVQYVSRGVYYPRGPSHHLITNLRPNPHLLGPKVNLKEPY